MVENQQIVGSKSHEKYSNAVLILLQDCALSLVASLLSILLVRWISSPILGFTAIVLKWLITALVATVIATLISGSHKVVRKWATAASISKVLTTVVLKMLLMIAAVIFVFYKYIPSVQLCVVAILCDTLITAFLLFYSRFIARVLNRSEAHDIKKSIGRKNALVGGVTRESIEQAYELEASGDYNVLGFISTEDKMSGRILAGKVVYVAHDAYQFEALEWRLGGIDCVFLSKGSGAKEPKERLFNKETNPEVDKSGMNMFGRFIKRSFDVCVSGVLILIFSPLAAICALAIKLEDGSPVLYKQERIGKDGKPFNILKFRSMRIDAEADGAQLYSGDDDPRLTKVGHFLRVHHLDELPQLLNVFKGDMSFIGYRPEREYYIEQIMERNPRYKYLYQIRPGVTSYATLYNGYTDTIEKMLTRLDLDLYYLRHHSVAFDIKVLALTFLNIVSGKTF